MPELKLDASRGHRVALEIVDQPAFARTGVQHFKESINLKALKLLESFSRPACHCDALVFLFYRSPITPLPERAQRRTCYPPNARSVAAEYFSPNSA